MTKYFICNFCILQGLFHKIARGYIVKMQKISSHPHPHPQTLRSWLVVCARQPGSRQPCTPALARLASCTRLLFGSRFHPFRTIGEADWLAAPLAWPASFTVFGRLELEWCKRKILLSDWWLKASAGMIWERNTWGLEADVSAEHGVCLRTGLYVCLCNGPARPVRYERILRFSRARPVDAFCTAVDRSTFSFFFGVDRSTLSCR